MAVSVEEFRNEMRALHAEVHAVDEKVGAWRLSLENRVATLEAHDEDISGKDGKKGRVEKLEDIVEKMGYKFAYLAALAWMGGTVAAVVGWYFPRH